MAPVRAWIMTCNPKVYEFSRLRDEGIHDTSWNIGRYRDHLAPGDPFALWITGPHGGIIANGRITSTPQATDNGDDDPSWIRKPRNAWDVPLRIDEWLPRVIPSQLIRRDDRFSTCTVLSQPFAPSPHRLDEEQWTAVCDFMDLVRPPTPAPGQREPRNT